MENKKIDVNKVFKYWIVSSDRDFDTMTHLYSTKDFHWALFMGHLVLKNYLKR